MTTGEWRFEYYLQPNDIVQVHWTNSGRAFTGKGAVVKVNRSSIRVELLEDVAPEWYGGYPAGREITVPRFGLHRWTPNNRVAPLGDP